MSDKLFHRIILLICAVGIAVTIGLVIYTCYLHDTCSILTFIANERS